VTTIIKQAKRASQASNRRSIAIARLRMGLSMAAAERLAGDDEFTVLAALPQPYRPHVVEATQDVSVLRSHYSNSKQARETI
jgi:hypothetical protein